MILAFKQLWRNFRSGEVRVMALSLVLAVAVVSCIAIFTSRLENSLVQQSHTFLGADRVVQSSQPFPSHWFERAANKAITTAQTVSFASMVFADERMHLASVKAVSEEYPIVGDLMISEVAFSSDPEQMSISEGVPKVGEAWVDSRLLALLDIELQQNVFVGEKSLTVTKVIVSEPDRGSNFSLIGARLLMNVADLAATEVIQAGSRIRYKLLLGGESKVIDEYLASISPEFSSHQQVIDVETAQRGLAKTLTTARKFLLIASVVGVLLGGVAIAIAARHFAVLQVDQIALLKSFGASSWKIRGLYIAQLTCLGFFSSGVGLGLGQLLQYLVVAGVGNVLPVTLLPAHWSAYGLGLLTGFICLIFFVLPPLWTLPSVPPIKILRRDMQVHLLQQYWQFLLGLSAIVLLVLLFSGDASLAIAVVGALLVLVLSSVLMSLLILWCSTWFGRRAGSVWRLGLAALERNRQQSVIQMLVFSLAIMLLLTMVTIRTSLVDEWKTQLPEGTPNHFIVNISPDEVLPIKEFLAAHSVTSNHFYPMVRARLTHINDTAPSSEQSEKVEALQRELNLSWAEQLSADNNIIEGQWWDTWQSMGPVAGVSVEAKIAKGLGLSLGDELTFSVGGLNLQARVASIRTLRWDSMNPNFYFLFSPGALDDFYPSYLTSVYLQGSDKMVINQLLRQFPTMVVIEMDRVIAQIQSMVEQVSLGVELVLVLILVGGFLVMWASVNSSMNERMQETVLLRALGCSRKRLLGSLWIEFSTLGACAGLMAVLGSEALLLSLQANVLQMEVAAHWYLWPLGIIVGAGLIGALGVLVCRSVVTLPPGRVLRELN